MPINALFLNLVGTGMEKLSVKGLALGVGSLWSLYVLCAGWTASFGWFNAFVATMGTLYIGYAPGFVGGIIGGIWAFFDGAVAGAVIVWVYNWSLSPKKTRR